MRQAGQGENRENLLTNTLSPPLHPYGNYDYRYYCTTLIGMIVNKLDLTFLTNLGHSGSVMNEDGPITEATASPTLPSSNSSSGSIKITMTGVMDE